MRSTQKNPFWGIERTIAHAESCVESFRKQIDGYDYEERGILFSEMLFLYATVGDLTPKNIIESGRARGQSTLLLTRFFPNSTVVSIERYEHTPDEEIARARLCDVQNVDLRYGDSRSIIPKVLEQGDVVLIDGPKGFRALRLALELLRTGKPSLVFVHDLSQGLRERVFLDRYVAEAFFSDDEEFVSQNKHVDDRCWKTINKNDWPGWKPYEYKGLAQRSYGPTMACIPHCKGKLYGLLLIKLAVLVLLNRTRLSLKNRVHEDPS